VRSVLLLLSRIFCFLAIAVGIVSLLSTWTGETGGVLRHVLLAPGDALGLIFVGFAVRLSRLEAHRRPIRVIVQTSRLCLLALGVVAIFGSDLTVLLPSTGASGTGFAAGVIFLLIAGVLMMRVRHAQSEFRSILTAGLCAFLVSCWISLLLASGGLAPVPSVLRIEFLTLLLLSGVGAVLASLIRAPGVLGVLADEGPEASAARLLFPLAFVIPLVLAILRHRAEVEGLLHRDLGLLLHVILSAGSMAIMIVWNAHRISAGARAIRAAEKLMEDFDSQYRAILGAFSEPVWIFDPKGQLIFENRAAGEYGSGEEIPGARFRDPSSALGSAQQRAILSAALFGRRVREIRMFDQTTGEPRLLTVQYLGVLYTREAEPSAIVLVARPSGERAEAVVGLQSSAEPLRAG